MAKSTAAAASKIELRSPPRLSPAATNSSATETSGTGDSKHSTMSILDALAALEAQKEWLKRHRRGKTANHRRPSRTLEKGHEECIEGGIECRYEEKRGVPAVTIVVPSMPNRTMDTQPAGVDRATGHAAVAAPSGAFFDHRDDAFRRGIERMDAAFAKRIDESDRVFRAKLARNKAALEAGPSLMDLVND